VFNRLTITANGDTSMGSGGDQVASSIQFQVTGLAGANITPKRRCYVNVPGIPSAAPTVDALVSVAYKKASDETWVAAGTAITVDGIYTMISDGAECVLTTAAFAGNITIDAIPFAG
jgi:hypothetical protein